MVSFQHGEQWGGDDSEDVPDGVCYDTQREQLETTGAEGCSSTGVNIEPKSTGVRSSDAHASYFRDDETRVDYVLVYEVRWVARKIFFISGKKLTFIRIRLLRIKFNFSVIILCLQKLVHFIVS